jgi:CBS domain-containing protein
MQKLSEVLECRELYYVEVGQTVGHVAGRMSDLNVGAILVLESGALRGLFSERDLMRRVVAAGRSPEETKVEAVMTTDVVAIDESSSTEQAMALMRRYGCRHLPVLRGTRVLGMVSMRDLMNLELEEKTQEIAHMRSYIQSVC